MARLCPRWRHVWRHMRRDAAASLPSSESLPLMQSPTALIRASREHKSLAETLFCASTVSRAASRRVINKARWKRSCSPLPAVAPQHTALRAGRARHGQQPPGTSGFGSPRCLPSRFAFLRPQTQRGLGAVQAGKALQGGCAMPGPCAQRVLPPVQLRLIPALGRQGAGGWRWGGREEMREEFGSNNASLKCS